MRTEDFIGKRFVDETTGYEGKCVELRVKLIPELETGETVTLMINGPDAVDDKTGMRIAHYQKVSLNNARQIDLVDIELTASSAENQCESDDCHELCAWYQVVSKSVVEGGQRMKLDLELHRDADGFKGQSNSDDAPTHLTLFGDEPKDDEIPLGVSVYVRKRGRQKDLITFTVS